jgi:hypothetical protein
VGSEKGITEASLTSASGGETALNLEPLAQAHQCARPVLLGLTKKGFVCHLK